MTKEEAIAFLTRYVGNEYYTPQCQEAHRMAIAALREQEGNFAGLREKLIELLMHIPQVNYAEAHAQGMKYVFGCAADYLIANGVTVQQWIPVEEQKPEENKNVKIYTDGNLLFASVLVCGGQRGVTIANRVNIQPVGIPYINEHATNGWEWSVGNEDVTHWMPLPEPPKED